MVSLVGIVRLLVVLKALRPPIVVEINAEEKFRAIRGIAQKRFVVVGEKIYSIDSAILVEIRYEVAILVISGENRRVGHAADLDFAAAFGGDEAALTDPQPVGLSVVVVVVIDKLVVQVDGLGGVVRHPVSIYSQDASAVPIFHTKSLAPKAPRPLLEGQIDQPAYFMAIPRDAVDRTVGIAPDAGVFSVLGIEVYFSVKIEAIKIPHLGRQTDDLIGRRQPIVEDDLALVQLVFDIAIGPRHR